MALVELLSKLRRLPAGSSRPNEENGLPTSFRRIRHAPPFIERNVDRRFIAGQFTWFLVWAAVTAVGACLTPSASGHGTHQELGLPPCPSVLLFDRPCPGCGLTTCWCALIHGQIGPAFHAHALGPFLYLGFTVVAWVGLYGFLRRIRFNTDTPLLNRGLILFTVVFLVYGFGRMALTPHFGTSSERLFGAFLR